MTDYNSLKVPDLKKLLSDRSLTTTGVKADLIARLQEDDKTKSSASPATVSAPPAGEDEIDWDEDDAKPTTAATTAPAAAAINAGGTGAVPTPTSVPNQVSAIEPSTTSDLKVASPSTEAKPATETATTDAPKPEEPKQDFSANLELTDAEKEAVKRAERAKRFGVITVEDDSEESKKRAERAKKFGTENEKADVKGLDSALPDRKERGFQKRGRDDQGGRHGGPKRHNNGGGGGGRNGRGAGGMAGGNGARRNGGGGGGARNGGGGGGGRRIIDDPVERAKAAARAARFGA